MAFYYIYLLTKILLFLLTGASLKNFFYSHVSYVHPDIVIRKRNVIILDVTSEQIVFTINPAHVDIFNFTK